MNISRVLRETLSSFISPVAKLDCQSSLSRTKLIMLRYRENLERYYKELYLNIHVTLLAT